MHIIGYTSERLAAAYCLDCAKKRWANYQLTHGKETVMRPRSDKHSYAHQYNLHPIFSTDEQDFDCDDCMERIN